MKRIRAAFISILGYLQVLRAENNGSACRQIQPDVIAFHAGGIGADGVAGHTAIAAVAVVITGEEDTIITAVAHGNRVALKAACGGEVENKE